MSIRINDTASPNYDLIFVSSWSNYSTQNWPKTFALPNNLTLDLEVDTVGNDERVCIYLTDSSTSDEQCWLVESTLTKLGLGHEILLSDSLVVVWVDPTPGALDPNIYKAILGDIPFGSSCEPGQIYDHGVYWDSKCKAMDSEKPIAKITPKRDNPESPGTCQYDVECVASPEIDAEDLPETLPPTP